MASIEDVANYLNVSVGYVGDLISRRELRVFPAHPSGTFIPEEDAIKCKRKMIEDSNRAIHELALLTQELGLS